MIVAVCVLAALSAGANGRACITFEQTRLGASSRTVDVTTCADLLLDSVPPLLSSSSTVLRFSNNRLTYLHRDTFARLPKLEEADFSANEIVHIATNLSSRTLSNLSLAANKLRTVPNATFEMLPNLLHLDLSRNEIWTLFAGSFRGLSKLVSLSLGGNLIASVDVLTFAPLISIRQLNMAANLLQSLPAAMNGTISPSLRSVQLGGNRWTCDCHVRWLKELVTEYNVQYDKADTLCTQAAVPSARGKRWFELRYAEFVCAPLLSVPPGQSRTREQLIGANATFECEGSEATAIRWKRIDSQGSVLEIDDGSNKYSTESVKATGVSSLTVHRVFEADSGVYYCEAGNLAGVVRRNFSLKVLQAMAPRDRELLVEPRRAEVSTESEEGLLGMIQNNTVNLLALIGALVGIVVVIVVLVAGIVYCVQSVAARGYEQRCETTSKQSKRLLDDGPEANGAPSPSPAPTSVTTVTVLPPSARYVQLDCGRPDSPASDGTLTLHQNASCPVHGLRLPVAPDFCPVHGPTGSFHHCPVHGDMLIPNDCSMQSFKSRLSESIPELLPLNDFHLSAQPSVDADTRTMSPSSFNLPPDCRPQPNPSAKVYIETDVDADLTDLKTDYRMLRVTDEQTRCFTAATLAECAASTYSTSV